MTRRVPDGLTGRFMLLLAMALIVANLAAFVIMSFDRAQSDRAAIRDREIERIVSLVPAIEAVDPVARPGVARSSSTRFSRVSVDPRPLVENGRDAGVLTQVLSQALPGQEVRGAMTATRDRGRDAVVLSIRLSDSTQWLNVLTRANMPPSRPLDNDLFLLLLALSLAATLGVSALFLRRLTRPLNTLTDAARAAGAGDRGARVPETGPLEVRDLAQAFNAMQVSIARFDAERMRTMGAVGHDLRTPITSLRIRAEMLDPADADPMVRTLDEMTVIADGLVAFAKGASEAEATDIVDIGALLARTAQDRGVAFVPAEPMHVRGRPVALGRALGNLIDNALRYGGSACVSAVRDETIIRINIEDDGPGIDPDRIDAMFDPFTRGEDSRNADTGGAGLGLSIARTILHAHGGSVNLRNRPSGGLSAVVELTAFEAALSHT